MKISKRGGFTAVGLAITSLVLGGLFAMATFREGAIIGAGIAASGLLLALGEFLRSKGRRAAAIVCVVLAVISAGLMARGCSASMAAARQAQAGAK